MNEAPITIRSMQIDDLQQVRVIDQLSFSMPWPESAYRYELTENPASRSWVATYNSPNSEPFVVGMIVVWLILDEAHIATLAVHPDYRGKGIGSALLVEALKSVVSQGASSALLEVRASNITAQRLYHHYGFEIVSRRPRYYKDNHEDALLMNLGNLSEALLRIESLPN
jgi:ribosomal-protein-alanine N-acetyltransferase